MIEHWIVRARQGGEEQCVQSAGGPPPYDPDAFEMSELPRELGVGERWDWDSEEIVSRFTPAEAAALVWERAKAYRDEVRYFATVPVENVEPGEIIMVECRGNSRTKVSDLALAATWAKQVGAPYSITFKDGGTPNRLFTVNADQTIAIKAALTVYDGLCHAASQGVLAMIEAATAAGATADEILAIDVTANYPDGPISPPLPPQEET